MSVLEYFNESIFLINCNDKITYKISSRSESIPRNKYSMVIDVLIKKNNLFYNVEPE